MARRARQDGEASSAAGLQKAPTGIQGLDEITQGGLPRGRPTLVCGGAGCGKTMLAAEFLVHGATEFNEPGVFMMFEENVEELTLNMRSLGFDLDKLRRQKKIALDFVRIERSEIEETGEYDLEGLFIRLGHAIDTIGAKRVVLDTLEALFAGLPNHAILRAELRRLFRWLKDRGMTAIITGERGETSLSRYGLEEYVADCVILLDHRIVDQVSTRRLRVIKYRGSAHGTNEYPFLIGEQGLTVLPITSMRLDHQSSSRRVSTGISKLDSMLGGQGIYKGSSVLVTGAPGTGKSSIGISFLDAACARGERALLFAYEESPSQLARNMRSIGIDLDRWVKKGLLQIHASRPTLQGLEQHLALMHATVMRVKPDVVLVDPISNLVPNDDDASLKPTLMRLIDFLKQQNITAFFTSLTGEGGRVETQSCVSSLMDSWLILANMEFNGERTRTIQILKSRGMPHSNQIREFVLSDHGIDLVDVYLADDRVLTGSARIQQVQREEAIAALRHRDQARRLSELASHRKAIDAQIAVLEAEAQARAGELHFTIERENLEADGSLQRSKAIAQRREGTASRKTSALKTGKAAP
jgi:circadian clock protein KaiC